MKLSPILENYLEVIFLLSEEGVGARLSDIAEKVGVTKATANRAIATLSQFGLVVNERYKEIHLNPKGQAYADGIFHKHKVIKQFFIDVLQIDKDVANQEACLIEHVISSDSIRAMEHFMKQHCR
ncbi:metal-dependent transcriptional regulator [Lysinibacillus sp. NPDC092081]|uniref:metal-dependent transcriptional regulator n=1 Tax=Lysinibacillus sp. NPDC092081 TaxID=3364131 RepID=UPI003810050E